MEEGFAELVALLSKQGNRGYRRYELKKMDVRLVLVRHELDRLFELAVSEAFGTELEPDDKDGMFLD
jgi:hypothetical protein